MLLTLELEIPNQFHLKVHPVQAQVRVIVILNLTTTVSSMRIPKPQDHCQGRKMILVMLFLMNPMERNTE